MDALPDYDTWTLSPEAQRIEDPLGKIQAYDDTLRRELFKRGEYGPEIEQEIVDGGAGQALSQGLIQDPAEYVGGVRPSEPDINWFASRLIQDGDTEKGQALYRYSSFLSKPDTDPGTLSRAEQEAALDPERKTDLLRKAVKRGELPFAVMPDGKVEVDANLGALGREEILDLADTVPGGVDARVLPALEAELTRIPGTNYTKAEFRAAGLFDKFIAEKAKTDDFLAGEINKAQEEYDFSGSLSEQTRSSLEASLKSLDPDGEFTDRQRALFIDDSIKRGASPSYYDPSKPEQHVQYLNDGTVWLPEQVVFDKEKYDELADKLDLTDEQKATTKALREGRLAAIAPAYVDAMGADPDALDFFEEAKKAGKTDAQIAAEWFGNEENYGKIGNRARSLGMALYEAGPGLVESVAALAGSDAARESIMQRQSDMARNEEYARLFGDSYGIGQSLANTGVQVAADLLVGLGVSAVATPAAGAAVTGARSAGQALVRNVTRQAVSGGARETARAFLKSGVGTASRTLATLGKDAVDSLARSIGSQTGIAVSSFTRSAGSAYASAYSALNAQVSPAGIPKYSEAEKRKIALGTAVTQGMSTAAITLGFGKVLGQGVEGLISGKIGTGILRRVYGMTDDQIVSATRESALSILKAAGAEGAEEAADQIVGEVIQSLGTGKDFRIGSVLKDALDAALVGGVLGASVKGIEVGVDKYRSEKAKRLADVGAPATAAAVEAQASAPEAPAAPVEEIAAADQTIAELEAQIAESPTETDEDKAAVAELKQQLGEVKAAKIRLEAGPVASEPTEVQLSPDPFTYGEDELGTDTLEPVRVDEPVAIEPTETQLSPDPFTYGEDLGADTPETVLPLEDVTTPTEAVTDAPAAPEVVTAPTETIATTAAQAPKDTQAAAILKTEGRPLPQHQPLFDSLVQQGLVPDRNTVASLLAQGEAGFGGTRYVNAFVERVRAEIEEAYPIIPLPDNHSYATLKSLGRGDWKEGGKLISIPVNEDGKTAPFTNDPRTTAFQLDAGLSVPLPTGLSAADINPGIKRNAKGTHVASAMFTDGRIVTGKGDLVRPGTTVAEFVARSVSPEFAASLATVPPFDSARIPAPIDYAGMKIEPGVTTEDMVLAHFFAPRADGSPSRVEAAATKAARDNNLSAAQETDLVSAVQASLIRELREYTLEDPAVVDPTGFGKSPEAYKTHLKNRKKVWEKLGRPAAPSFFLNTELAKIVEGNARREVTMEESETVPDRAPTEAVDTAELVSALDEAFGPDVLRGISAMQAPGTAVSVEELIRKMDEDLALKRAVRSVAIKSHTSANAAARQRFAAAAQDMDSRDLLLIAGRAVAYNTGLVNGPIFKSLIPGVSTWTEAEIEQHRADNRAALQDLQLEGDFRAALERIVRVSKYPRRYRAIIQGVLKMPVLPSLQVVDFDTEAYAGAYTPSSHSVFLNLASSNGRGLLDVLSHELLHAATVQAIANPQTKAQKDFVAKMERARQQAADAVPADMAYAVSSLDEFAAHAATDPRFQRILRETMDRGKSTWDRFVEAVAKFFGIGNKDFVDELLGFVEHSAVYGYRGRGPTVRSAPSTDWTRKDAEYLAAVERGDMATAQRMVDDAARAAGYRTRAWHAGTVEGITEFAPLSHFASDPRQAQAIRRRRESMKEAPATADYDVFLDTKNYKRVDDQWNWEARMQEAVAEGFSGLVYKNYGEGFNTDEGAMFVDSFVPADPSQIKSADPVTRDDNGNVIPLSQRFRPSSPDIRYSLPTPQTTPDLPPLPEGLAYAYDARPGYLAYARRSQPTTITVNQEALAALTAGLDPANAKAITKKVIDHEIAHLAAFQAFTADEIREMTGQLTDQEIDRVARRYYDSPDASERLAADLASGTMTEELVLEEWLRMQVELIETGSTTEELIAFHKNDPGFASRLLRYLRDFIKSLWTRVTGPVEDYATRTSINRLMREYRAIKNGHLDVEAKPFDTSDPYRDNKRGALEIDYTDPESAVLEDMMRRDTFIDWAGAYNGPPESIKGTLDQLLKSRTGDPRFEAANNERTARLNAANALLANRQKAFTKAMKREGADAGLVNRALGDNTPTIPSDVRKALKDQYDAEVQAARELEDAEEQQAALREARDKYNRLKREVLVETARQKKEDISRAFEELRAASPDTAKAVKQFRASIDSMSKILRDALPEDSYLRAVIDENLGVYLTRTYRVHHGDGDPLGILKSDDPADVETVAAAEEIFVKAIIEGKTEDIVEEEAEAGKIISYAEAEAVARAEVAEAGTARMLLEDYIMSHGSRAFYHGGGNFKLDLTRYMQKADVPEALRKVLGEVTDPVENAARTFANVSYMAANHRFIEQLARGGKQTGGLVTKEQRDVFPNLVREADEESYLQGTIAAGFARATPTPGYVKVADNVFHPVWLVEAREKRDFRKLDGYQPIATTNKKYGAGSLDGLYAAPLIHAFFSNTSTPPSTLANETFVRKAGEFFAKATGASLGIATVTNPAFHIRNMLGGTFFLGANGINPLRGFGQVASHFTDLALGRDNPEVIKRIALGVYSNDLRPQAIKELIKDEIDKPGDRSAFEWLGNLLGGKRGQAIGEKVAAGALKLTDVAGAVDSFIKGIAYESELETLTKAHPDWTTARLESAAADIVLRTQQSRSMTVPVAETVTRSSFGKIFAPFLRFRAEMFRITSGTVAQGIEEIASDNPVIRARGRERLAGFSSIAALSLAGPALISAMLGVGEDEEYALREALPPYLRGNSITYWRSGDSITSLDTTFLNPYSMIFDPMSRTARAFMRGEPGEAAGEVSLWLAGQFLEEQIAAGAALEVLNNRTADNKPIVYDTDGFVESTVKYAEHLIGSAYTPQALKIVARAVEAERRGVPEDAAFFDTPAGILSGTVVPARPRSFSTEDLALRAFRNKAQTLRDIRALAGQYKRRQNLDDSDIEGITDDIYDSMVSLYEDMDKIAVGFEGLGMEPRNVVKQIVNAGHSRDKAKGIVFSGRVAAPSLSPDVLRDIFDAGEDVDPNGGGARRVKMTQDSIRSRPRVIELPSAED